MVDELYADYSIEDGAFANADNLGALKLPSYGLADLGLTYTRVIYLGMDSELDSMLTIY